MARNVKECLRKVLGNATFLAEVDATVNCRPLTYDYDEPGEVLTPSHLIYGRSIRGTPDDVVEPNNYADKGTCDEWFKYLTTKTRHFWNRWRSKYQFNLKEFHRPKVDDHGIVKVNAGDVITVWEEDVKRNMWKLGVIESLRGRMVS